MYVDPATIQDPTVGDPLSAAWLHAVRDAIDLIARPPGAVTTATTQAAATATWVDVEWTTPARDVGGFWTANKATDLVVPAGADGWYTLTTELIWAGNSAGGRNLALGINGSTRQLAYEPSPQNNAIAQNAVAADFWLDAGDIVTVRARHSVGSSLNINSAAVSLRLVAHE